MNAPVRVVPERPKRLGIPMSVKRMIAARQGGVCKCGCGTPVWDDRGRALCQFDHEPALRLREINEEGTDYIPPQRDPAFIDARCRQSHGVKTYGSGATTAGTDIGKIKKRRKRERPRMKRPFRSRKAKMQSRGFDKRFTRKMDRTVVPRRRRD